MEPWDGPAGIAFTDGVQIGATLDRNGLRPARYVVTEDDIVVMASETGVLPFEAKSILKKKVDLSQVRCSSLIQMKVASSLMKRLNPVYPLNILIKKMDG